MPIRVKKNRLGAVAREIEKAPKAIIDDASAELVSRLKSGASSVWKSSTIAGTVKNRSSIPAHAVISVGLNRSTGFYSRFLEWGTKDQNARPMVTPRVEAFKAEFAAIAKDYVRKAANSA